METTPLYRLIREVESRGDDWETLIQKAAIRLSRKTGEIIKLSQILNGRFWRLTVKTRKSYEIYGLLTRQEVEILAQRQIIVLDQEGR